MPSTPQDSSLNSISLEYSYASLCEATRNFDASHQLGHGSFGGVFRGVQKDGTEVAIKVLEVPEEAGFEEEVRVLSKFRHPNLVILMGFARHENRRFLVYEMLAGGDVYRRLQKSCAENVPFTARQRVSVLLDASCGLSHLHNATPKVFHRDIKSPNILMDRNGTAKMADFGLACLTHNAAHKVDQASGTVGYACPYYVQKGIVTEGSEVYSFGMVILELITASPPAYVSQNTDGSQQFQFLVTHINGDPRVAMSMADQKAGWTREVLPGLVDLALRCIQMEEEGRPGFHEVVTELRRLQSQAEAPLGSPLQAHYRGLAHNQPYAGLVSTGAAPGQIVAQPMLVQQAVAMPQETPQVVARQLLLQAPVAAVVQPPQLQQAGLLPAPVPAPVPSPPPAPPPQVQEAMAMTAVASGAAAPRAMGVVYQQAQVVYDDGTGANAWAASAPAWRVHAGVEGVPGDDAWFLGQARLPERRVTAPAFVPQEVPACEPAVAQHQLHAAVAQHYVEPALVYANGVQAPRSPTLWVLECIQAEGANLGAWPREMRSMVHAQEVGGALTTMRVGRLFWESFFDTVLQKDDDRKALVGREHFQIWAEDMAGLHVPLAERMPCSFFLTNFDTRSGTVVNGQRLQVGEQVPLHSGDMIFIPRPPAIGPQEEGHELVPLVSFCFDLTGSVLYDAEVGLVADVPRQVQPQVPPPGGGLVGKIAARAPPVDLAGVGVARGSLRSTSFVGANMTALFMLEVGGPAVRADATQELRRIAHGPPGPNEGIRLTQADLCPPLLLGRSQQPGFWQRLLCEEAFNALSRQHLQIEACEQSNGETGFCVRNLSDLNPIRLFHGPDDNGKQEEYDSQPPLLFNERRLLANGDTIVVNPSQDHMLWLVFTLVGSGKLEWGS